MKKIIIPCLALVGWLTACSTPGPMPDTVSYGDLLHPRGIDMIPENLVEGGATPDDCVWLNAARIPQDRSHSD